MSLETFESEIHLPGLVLPIRSSLIRSDLASVLISPIKFKEAEVQRIIQQGGVSDIIAPSMLHHLYISAAKRNFKTARLWCTEGLQTKRSDISWDHVVHPANWPFGDFLKMQIIEGMPKVNEIAFFHEASKSLILIDLCFNLQDPRGFASGLLLRLFGTYKKFNVSGFFTMQIKDKVAFRKSLEKILEWNFERILMAHGQIIEADAKELFEGATRKFFS